MICKNIMRNVFFISIFFFLTQEIYSTECGWANRIERFLRDHDAMEGSWPWMVAIMKSDIYGVYTHMCSGSMISSKHVLTAAQCFESRNSSLYKVKIGNVDERLAQEYNITRVVPHNTYVRGRHYDDIAILTLEKNIDFENFNPICLPPNHEFENLTGHYTAIVGWGSATPLGPSYPKLREKFGLVVLSNAKCNESFFRINSKSQLPQGITGGMICTAHPNECVGDSGSPLIYQVDDQWYAVGILSFGMSCDTEFPRGYIRVSEYLNWIERNIKLGCGWSQRINDSILHGEAAEGSWPWMVAIVVKNKEGDFEHLCSGSMISNKHVLTVAHCIGRQRDPIEYKARIGNVDERLAKEYNISRIVVHADYSPGRFNDDIAILTLNKEVDLENFDPVCLPPSSEFKDLQGQNTTVVGWERSRSAIPSYPVLREDFGLKVIPNSRCYEMFNRMNAFKRQFPKGIDDGMLCTDYTSECLGDSGSPLMYQEEGKWYVVGLASFGRECGVPDFPVGFTKVTKYLEWIEENMKS